MKQKCLSYLLYYGGSGKIFLKNKPESCWNKYFLAGCFILWMGCTSKQADHAMTVKDSISIVNAPAMMATVDSSQVDTLTWQQPEFVLNGVKCFWTGKLIVFRGDTMPHEAQFNLLAADNRKMMYQRMEETDRKGFEFLRTYDHLFTDLFKDINFDGYQDVLEYDQISSGSGGSFYNVFAFNSAKREFLLSKELSGADITVDTVNRTTSDFWKGGYGNYSQRVLHYSAKGKLLFTENITNELIETDTVDLQVSVTKKIINGKLVKTSVDTSVFEGY